MARFCRHCSEPVSFAKTEEAFNASVTFDGQSGAGESYGLSRYNVKEVYALKCYMGLLLIVADKSVLIFDAHSLHDPPLKSVPSPDGRAVRGATPRSTADDELLVVTTAQGIYQLSLLDLRAEETEICRVSKPSRIIYHSAFYCADELYFLEYDEAERTSRLIRSPDHEVVAFKGYSRQPLTVGDDQIFLCTETNIFLYDARRNSLQSQKAPEHLPPAANPAYSEESGTIYLVGENNLWRLSLSDPELSPMPLSTKAVGDPRIAASNDYLFVARSNGLIILSPFGDVQWDSMKNYISASSDLGAPIIYPKYFIFTSIGKLGGSDVRVHSRENPGRFELVSYERRLACSPTLNMSRLFAVTGEEGSIELNVN
ncbi:MAG TPA: hypothetical protein VNI02_08340 [Blastocatellia bacterium]|nr:hypothetical protein [Blastocatellia bacterium]